MKDYVKTAIENTAKIKYEMKSNRELTFKNCSSANKFAKELLKNSMYTEEVILTSKYRQYVDDEGKTTVNGGKKFVLTFQYWGYDFDKVNFEKLLKKYQDQILW